MVSPAPEIKKAMIVIAVSKYEGAYGDLPGVLVSADRLARWAEVDTPGRSYDVLEITDAGGHAVTMQRLREEIEGFLDTRRVDRLFIYFAGHGLVRSSSDQFWLLTNAGHDRREGVDLFRFIEGLGRYGIGALNKHMTKGQLIIFADACRNASSEAIQFLGDPILTRNGRETKLEREINLSTTLGAYAFQAEAVNGSEPYCIFTEALCDALEGKVEDVFEEVSGLGTVIHNHLLAQHLEKEVTKRARAFGENMTPDMNPGLQIYNHYYDILPKKVKGGSQPKPQPSTEFRTTRISRTGRTTFPNDIRLDLAQDLVSTIGALTNRRGTVLSEGHSIVAIPAGSSRAEIVERRGTWLFTPPESTVLTQPIVRQGDIWTVVPVYPNSISTLMARNAGDVFVLSKDQHGEDSWDTSLTSGYVNHNGAVPSISKTLRDADRLRLGKEIQPQRADLAAYAYRLVGDDENIVRTAHFMHQAGFLSFDLALLAGTNPTWARDPSGWRMFIDLPEVGPNDAKNRPWYAKTRMNARRNVPVNTLFPVYRVGWQSIPHLPKSSVPPGFTQLSEMVLGYPAAVFPTEAIQYFAEFFDYEVQV